MLSDFRSPCGRTKRQGKAIWVIECWYTRAERELKTGSFWQPFSRTPRDVGSMRKCRTSSSGDFSWTLDGTVETFRAIPKAPGKEFESRTTKVPGGCVRSIAMAGNVKIYDRFSCGESGRHSKSQFVFHIRYERFIIIIQV